MRTYTVCVKQLRSSEGYEYSDETRFTFATGAEAIQFADMCLNTAVGLTTVTITIAEDTDKKED